MAECPLMARRLVPLVAILGLTAVAAAAQSPSAGTGTIFVGSYSGHLTAVDEAALFDEAREVFSYRAAERDAARRGADRLLPVYAEVVRRSAAIDVGLDRWARGR